MLSLYDVQLGAVEIGVQAFLLWCQNLLRPTMNLANDWVSVEPETWDALFLGRSLYMLRDLDGRTLEAFRGFEAWPLRWESRKGVVGGSRSACSGSPLTRCVSRRVEGSAPPQHFPSSNNEHCRGLFKASKAPKMPIWFNWSIETHTSCSFNDAALPHRHTRGNHNCLILHTCFKGLWERALAPHVTD